MIKLGSLGNGGGVQKRTMYQHIRRLGLLNGLKLCLDAGDAGSYNSAVQTTKWLDTSGNGYDFYRGTSTGGDAAEPTFNGTAGKLSSSEYWSFDGGDYFLYDTTNETWMQNLHKDNAKFTVVSWIYPAGATSNAILGTASNLATNIGITHFVNTSNGTVGLQIRNGSGSNVINTADGTSITGGAWNFTGVSVDEAAGTGIIIANSEVNTFTSTYTSPSASNATYTMQLASSGNGATSPIRNTGRLAAVMVWESVTLTEGQLRAIHHATRWRFGV